MPRIFPTETGAEIFRTGKRMTTVDLAVALGCSRSRSKVIVQELRQSLVIVGYEPPRLSGRGGAVSPIYKWRESDTEVDAIPPTRGLNAKERLAMAWERKKQNLRDDKKEALARACSVDEIKQVNKDFDERMNEMVSDRMERERRWKKKSYEKRKIERRINNMKSGSYKTSLATCWSQPIL